MHATTLCTLAIWASFTLGSGLEGTLVPMTTFNGELIMENHVIPPNGSTPNQHKQQLTGLLANYSSHCTLCVGTTSLTFKMGSTNIVVLLADHVLSVLHVTEGQRPVKLTQVLQLDKSCIPERLMTFSDFAKADFAVICKHLTIHFASINPDLNVTLEALSDQCRKNEGGVLMERGNEVQAVSYVGDNTIEICLLSSGFVETPSLPLNINCLTDATLYAVHAPETFLLHCETADGFTLYVVHVPVDTNQMYARAIQASGDPYSSENGTYIVMVDGQRVTAYITGDSNVPGNAKGFSSQITTLDFLNNHHVLILTEDGQHIVMDLKNSSSQPTYFSGGAPTTWTWVDSDIYIYTTKNDGLSTIHVFNMTSDKEIFEVKDITMQPERVLFVEKSAISPNPLPPPPGREDNTRVIAGATVGILVVAGIIVVFVILVAVNLRPYRIRRKLKHSSSTIELDKSWSEEKTSQSSTPTPSHTSSTSSTALPAPPRQHATPIPGTTDITQPPENIGPSPAPNPTTTQPKENIGPSPTPNPTTTQPKENIGPSPAPNPTPTGTTAIVQPQENETSPPSTPTHSTIAQPIANDPTNAALHMHRLNTTAAYKDLPQTDKGSTHQVAPHAVPGPTKPEKSQQVCTGTYTPIPGLLPHHPRPDPGNVINNDATINQQLTEVDIASSPKSPVLREMAFHDPRHGLNQSPPTDLSRPEEPSSTHMSYAAPMAVQVQLPESTRTQMAGGVKPWT